MEIIVVDDGKNSPIGLRLNAEHGADVHILKLIIRSNLDVSCGCDCGGKPTHVVIHGRRKVAKPKASKKKTPH